MRRSLQIFLGLTLLAALAEGLILIQIRLDPWRLAAFLESVSLMLGGFVGLTQAAFIKHTRQWAMCWPWWRWRGRCRRAGFKESGSGRRTSTSFAPFSAFCWAAIPLWCCAAWKAWAFAWCGGRGTLAAVY